MTFSKIQHILTIFMNIDKKRSPSWGGVAHQLGWPPGGLLGVLGASWGLLGPLGASWGPLGASWGRPGGPLGVKSDSRSGCEIQSLDSGSGFGVEIQSLGFAV